VNQPAIARSEVRSPIFALCSAEAVIFLAIWLALLLLGRTELFRDPGTFWHTAVGQRILDQGQIVRTDPFCFTFPQQPWVEYEWLADCTMALIYRVGGWDGLLLVTVTLLATIYAWTASRLLRSGLHLLPSVLVLGLVLGASSQNFHARPLILSIALLGWTFAWLVDVEAGRRPLAGLVWVVPVYILWGNWHGGILAGIGTLGLAFGGWCLAWLAGRPSPVRGWRDVAMLAALLVASAACLVLNPYGLDLPRSWAAILRMPLGHLIQEHAPLDLARGSGRIMAVLAAGYVALLAGVFPRWPRVTWLLPLVWMALAVERVRHAPLAAIVMAIAVADLLPYCRWSRWLARRGMFTSERPVRAPRFRRWGIPLAVVLLAIAVQLGGITAPVIGRGWVHFDPAHWPVALLSDLKAIPQTGRERPRIFNDMLFGGFLIFHTPQLAIFIDDRCEYYGREFLEAYVRAKRDEPGQVERWRRQYGFDHALVESGSAIDRYLDRSGRWRLVRRSGPAALWQTVP
jgi:hypothetical protein